jgi:hypothetical protein
VPAEDGGSILFPFPDPGYTPHSTFIR